MRNGSSRILSFRIVAASILEDSIGFEAILVLLTIRASFPTPSCEHPQLNRDGRNDNSLHLTKMLTGKSLKARMFDSHEPAFRSIRGRSGRPPPVEEGDANRPPGTVVS